MIRTATMPERTRSKVPAEHREEVAQILELAAKRIDTNGWRRGSNGDTDQKGTGCACAEGHIIAVSRRYFTRMALASLGAAADPKKDWGSGVYQWNDLQTDRRKVQRAMRRAARYLRGANR